MSGTKHTARMPGDVDRVVAKRVRALRQAHGMTQGQLASALGISTPMVQKYEALASRIGAARLHRIAEVFDVPVSYFFAQAGAEDAASELAVELLQVPGALELLRIYIGTADPLMRGRIRSFVEMAAHLEAAATNPNAAGDAGSGKAGNH